MKKTSSLSTFLMAIAFTLCFQVLTVAAQTKNPIKDVVIGTQVWTGENLNVDKFRNGDPIPQAKTEKEWLAAGENNKPVWCYYNFDPENGKKYGKLYNGYAITDLRGLAPKGWHIPSDAEWDKLIEYLGKEMSSTKLRSKNGWKAGNGTNESGFNGLPGGICTGKEGWGFMLIGEQGFWASTREASAVNVSSEPIILSGSIRRYGGEKAGLSVRCVRD